MFYYMIASMTSSEASGKVFDAAVRSGISREEIEDFYKKWADKYDEVIIINSHKDHISQQEVEE